MEVRIICPAHHPEQHRQNCVCFSHFLIPRGWVTKQLSAKSRTNLFAQQNTNVPLWTFSHLHQCTWFNLEDLHVEVPSENCCNTLPPPFYFFHWSLVAQVKKTVLKVKENRNHHLLTICFVEIFLEFHYHRANHLAENNVHLWKNATDIYYPQHTLLHRNTMTHTFFLQHTPTHPDECLPFNKGFLIIFHWFQGSVNLNQRSH